MFRGGMLRSLLIGSLAAAVLRMIIPRNRKGLGTRRFMRQTGKIMNRMNWGTLMRTGRKLTRTLAK